MLTETTSIVHRNRTGPVCNAFMAMGALAVALIFSADMALAGASGPNDPGAPGSRNVVSKTFKDCEACPEMVVVPAGHFVMGSPDSEPGNSRDEMPRHRVEIGQPFAVGKFEVTIGEWNACVADAGCGKLDASSDSERHPAVGMTWHEAQAYVTWLSGRAGKKKYRLLSEAEWEYVARAGTTTAYHTGPIISPRQANITAEKKKSAGSMRMSGFGAKIKRRRTVPVGSYPPNGFGLHDVHGNVWEWNQDCVNDGYMGAPTDGSAWETGKCHRRIIRGGSWVDYAQGARSAIRSGHGSTGHGRTLGLRIARTLD